MKRNMMLGALIGLSSLGMSTAIYAADSMADKKVTAPQVNSALAKAVASEFRTADNKLRDQYRHPAETLAFFDVKPEQTVIELWPGGGWYAEILAPYLAEKGQYVAANFETKPAEENRQTAYYKSAGLKFEKWVSDNKASVGNVQFVTLDPPAKFSLGKDNSADHVLTFRNLHNWAMKGELEGVFKAAHDVLKVGGSLGIVEHRANIGMAAESGYMDQNQMVELANKYGFELTGSSEVNANPKDSKDYEKGVWTLPPRLALGDQDKQKYLDIGESDRMTIKFTKTAAK
ncbi:class I SAM-dependent methyltransferase [Shewanella frigidimarina]|uniref:class I SAM-dependent methyltransferase n=1 Tax=Shewanella frigidimarina TaxID=56812 RepID=UPI000F4D5CB4|nr:methyltransferase [Shewanella frigidimarina]|tara:strand:+ start:14348 stop:15211 length:864 start_codon:yes stop_codon:yes gene_type:complete